MIHDMEYNQFNFNFKNQMLIKFEVIKVVFPYYHFIH